MANVHWNYTTVLNIIFLAVAAVLVWRFLSTGGLPMLRAMNKSRDVESNSGGENRPRHGQHLEIDSQWSETGE
jgi:hypothetical protein